MLDADKSGRVSKDEVCKYFTKLIEDKKTEGQAEGEGDASMKVEEVELQGIAPVNLAINGDPK